MVVSISECENDVIIEQTSCTTNSNDNRDGIVLDIEQIGGAELGSWNQRVIVWPSLLTHQLQGCHGTCSKHLKTFEIGRGCDELKSGIDRMPCLFFNCRITSFVGLLQFSCYKLTSFRPILPTDSRDLLYT